MKHIIYTSMIMIVLTGLSANSLTYADEPPHVVKPVSYTGEFIKKRYTVHGDWDIVNENGETKIQFADSFKTKSGPDLKVFLSPHPVEGLTNQTALDNAVKIGILKSNKGRQTYTIPSDLTLKDFQSVIIHCEAYSVLWGGFDIPE